MLRASRAALDIASQRRRLINNASANGLTRYLCACVAFSAGKKAPQNSVAARIAMSEADIAFDRYRKLLAEADDEPKRLAFVNLLIEERAKDRLARHNIGMRLAGPEKTFPQGKRR